MVVSFGGRLAVQEEGPATLLLPVVRARKPALLRRSRNLATPWHHGRVAATTSNRHLPPTTNSVHPHASASGKKGTAMHPKISLITLGVADLPRAIAFYQQGLGLPRHPLESDGVAFFALNGTWLSLFPRQELAKDIGISDQPQAGFSGITLAHNVGSKAEVDAVLAQAVAAGATLVKAAQAVFWGGYSGYFQDPDGHYWEVAFNPFMDLT